MGCGMRGGKVPADAALKSAAKVEILPYMFLKGKGQRPAVVWKESVGYESECEEMNDWS
jgi:hypothetical protein